MTRIVLSTDGYVAEDGRSAWAFVAEGDGHRGEGSGRLPPGPSHLAEWLAMEHGLHWAEANLREGDALDVRTDSALVVKGLARRRPEMSGEAAVIRADCRRALARLGAAGVRVNVARVGRADNEAADRLAREAARVGSQS